MAMTYNPIEDRFTKFEAVETPRVRKLDIDTYPLFNNPVDIQGITGVLDNGNVKAENNLGRMIRDTPKVIEQQDIQSNPSYEYSGEKTLKEDQKKNAVYMMNYLVNNGFQPHQAAGIVGNLARESRLDPGAYNSNDVGLPGGGIAGFRGENFSKLKAFANSKGKSWKDMDTQLDYLISTIGNGVRDKLSKAIDPHEASEAWADYERYAGYNWKLSSAKSWQKQNKWSDEKTMKWIENEHRKRSDRANEIYELWKSQS